MAMMRHKVFVRLDEAKARFAEANEAYDALACKNSTIRDEDVLELERLYDAVGEAHGMLDEAKREVEAHRTGRDACVLEDKADAIRKGE